MTTIFVTITVSIIIVIIIIIIIVISSSSSRDRHRHRPTQQHGHHGTAKVAFCGAFVGFVELGSEAVSSVWQGPKIGFSSFESPFVEIEDSKSPQAGSE